MDVIDEESTDQAEQPSTSSDNPTKFASVVKELAQNIDCLSVSNQLAIAEQSSCSRPKTWLTKSQRITIENSWKRATKSNAREQVGIQLFGRILAARPEMKHLFGLQKIPEGRLKYDPRFRRHAIVFTKSFDYIVKNVAYKEKLEQHFQALGERHTTLQGRGFDPGYWDTFNECMRQTVSLWGREKDHKTANTWHMLISFVLQNMKIGFNRANSRHPRRQSRTPNHRSADPTKTTTTRQGIDPLQFYQQFCLQQKKSRRTLLHLPVK
uniref:Globin family profile domain-containing protein n=1 Tax=Setaria digitata TaxID=48799 RepID=A0A915PL46_9BILA